MMKSFQAVILAAIVASAAAINEPVASPTAAKERELAMFESVLDYDERYLQEVTDAPTTSPTYSPTLSPSLMVSIFNE